MNPYYRCYAEIDLEAIGHNLREVRKRVSGETKVMAVIKADAYGHGAETVGRYIQENQLAQYFGVATLEEAQELRRAGIFLPVLILGYTSPSQYGEVVDDRITQTVYTMEMARAIEEAAASRNKQANIHIAVDTGMTRIGFHPDEAGINEVKQIASLPHINLEGMFTHFSCADQADKTYCEMQMEKYDWFKTRLEEEQIRIPLCHICNSAGIMEFDHHRYGMVRSGIVTYGLYPSEEVDKTRLALRPALSWKTHVIHVQTAAPGLGVSYGATYITERPTRIATLSVGYADGYPRSLSNKGRVLIHGQYAPIIGRVCMDQLMVDVSHIPDVQVEYTAILVGKENGNRISVEDMADLAGSFNYEFVCDISRRVKRVY